MDIKLGLVRQLKAPALLAAIFLCLGGVSGPGCANQVTVPPAKTIGLTDTQIRAEIDRDVAAGQPPTELAAANKAAYEESNKEPMKAFAWAYAAWRACEKYYPHGVPSQFFDSTQTVLEGTYEALAQPSVPKTYNVMRTMYLVRGDSHLLVQTGKELLEITPNDADVAERQLLNLLDAFGVNTVKDKHVDTVTENEFRKALKNYSVGREKNLRVLSCKLVFNDMLYNVSGKRDTAAGLEELKSLQWFLANAPLDASGRADTVREEEWIKKALNNNKD